jgi:arylsulfatase A-like enzyme
VRIRVFARVSRRCCAAALALTALASCGEGPKSEHAVQRFVDSVQPEGGARVRSSRPAVAELSNDARHVLSVSDYETPVIEIPPRSRLTLSTGTRPERGSSDGRVIFRLSACDGDRCQTILDEAGASSGVSPRWTEHEIALDDLAGERRSFRFETEVVGHGVAAASGLWANPTLLAEGPGERPGPNLILISLDTLRADHLGLYGYARETSPFIDRVFGDEGVIFERFVAAATSTGPSHMSIMTSLPPSQHGARSGTQALSAPAPMLAEWLRAEGFATAAFTENARLDRRRGFGRGFDVYVENKSSDLLNPVGDIERTFQQGRDWLARNRSLRSFLFLHTYQVHAPYAPPPRYRSLFVDRSVAAGEPEIASQPRRPVDDYDREIRYVDDELGKLFEWLDDQELLDRTLVVVTSDHGEAFLEHGYIGHGSLPHEEVVHVPLLMRGPGVPRGRRVASLAGHIDLLPTVLELLGIASPPAARGRSLALSLLGNESIDQPERPIFSESWTVQPPYLPPGISVRLGRHKLLSFRTAAGPGVHLFDLGNDPGEQRNIASAAPQRVRVMLKLLDEYRTLTRRGGREVRVDPDLEKKLRALGYVVD